MGRPERMWGDDLEAQTPVQAHETVGSGRVGDRASGEGQKSLGNEVKKTGFW